MLKTIIFDMDGVIVDSEPIFEAVEREMFKKYKIPIEEDFLKKYIGRKAKDFWKAVVERHKMPYEDLEKFLDEHTQRYLDKIKRNEEFCLIPGIRSTIETFKALGYQVYIASSSKRIIIQTIIRRFKLEEFIDGIVGAEDVKVGKPSPRIFVKVCKKANILPQEALVIEDSKNGILGAKNANISVVWYKGQSSQDDNSLFADFTIDAFDKKSIEEIIKLGEGVKL